MQAASETPTSSAAAVNPQTPGARLTSLDALRGFDMFWIMGGDLIIRSFPKIYDSAFTRELAGQMDHCEWAGFHFYDLIFPLFVFMVGVSIVFSVPRMIERGGRGAAIKRIVIRSIILFLLGIFYMGGVASGFKNVYLAGVLHRIAVAYFFTALIYCFLGGSSRFTPPVAEESKEVRAGKSDAPWNPGTLAMIFLTGVLLAGYWALMTFVTVPGIGAPSLDGPGRNLAHYLDELYLPGKKFEGTLLSTMPAVGNCLLGVFAGLLLRNHRITDQNKVYFLLAGGMISLGLGFMWAQNFPIIKLLWTSSYVLVACGYSALLLAAFFQIIEIWKFQRWAQPFIWMGMNAITIYIIANVLGFNRLAGRFVGGDIHRSLGSWGDFVQAVVGTFLCFCVVRFLYRRKIFLRL